MQINSLCKGVLTAAALCMLPAVLAASPKANRTGVNAAQPGTGAFANDASSLLQEVRVDALRVKDRADRLEALVGEPFLTDWQIDGDQLEQMRARVNNMDNVLFQLRTHESNAKPWQQKAIDRIAPTVVNLTNTTQAAIVSLNNNQGRIAFSNLEGLARDMYNQASLISKTIGDFEEYANARQEVRKLKQTLKVDANS